MTGERRTRRAAAASLCAAAVLVVGAVEEASAATIGSTAPLGSAVGCAGCSYFQHGSDSSSPSYVVPPGSWTITSWAATGGTGPESGTARLRVFRPLPTGAANRYLLVDQSPAATVPPGAVTSYPADVGVSGGDVIGLRTGSEGQVPGTFAGAGGDESWLIGGDPGVAFTVGTGTAYPGSSQIGRRVNVSATLEQDTTPPNTKITKRPPNRTRKHLQHYSFTANERGALFECKLDNHPYRSCIPPRKVRPKIGHHRFRVRAIDPAGNVDPTPASDRFRIVNG